MNQQSRRYPEGITAISRWLSEATPPERIADARIRSRRDRSASALASLRDANRILYPYPVVALRLPPANGSNPFGVIRANRLETILCRLRSHYY